MVTYAQMHKRRALAKFLKKAVLVILSVIVVTVAALALNFDKLKDFYHEHKANESIARARHFLKEGKAEGARMFLINAYRHRPNKNETLEIYKDILRQRKDAQYLGILLQIVRDMPGNGDNVIELLEYLDRNSLHNLTESLIPTLLQHQGNNPEVLFRISTHYAKQKKIGEAVSFISEARKIEPSNPKYEAQELTFQLLTKDRQTLISTRNRLDEIRNAHPEFFKQITISLAETALLDDPARSVALLDEILARDPSDWFVRVRRGLFSTKLQLSDTGAFIEDLWKHARTLEQKLYIIAMAHANLPPEHAETLLDKLPAREKGEKRTQQLQLMIDWENSRTERVLARAREQLLLDHPQFDKIIFAAWIYRVKKNNKDENSLLLTKDAIRKMAITSPEDALRAAAELSAWKDNDLLALLYQGIADAAPQLRQLTLTQLSNIYLSSGRIEDLHKTNLAILEVNPNDYRSAINFVRSALYLMKDLPLARQQAERLYHTDTNNPEFTLLFAEALHAEARYDLAKRIISQITDSKFRNQPYFQEFLQKLEKDSQLMEDHHTQKM